MGIWVPTQFNMQTFSDSGVAKSLLHVLPEAIPTSYVRDYTCDRGAVPYERSHFSFGIKKLDRFLEKADDNNTFTFLSIFKWEERKNWQDLLQTFWSTFPREVMPVSLEEGRDINLTVRLLIKTQELGWSTHPESGIEEVLGNLALTQEASVKEMTSRLCVVKDMLPSEMMPRLYHSVDAFVLPTHGEGWGLPLMEAMASGLPAIATNLGGSTEFMNSNNSLLLDYELEPSKRWANPNTTQLQEAMRNVVRRTDAVRSLAMRGCTEVRARFSTQAAA